MFNLIKRNIYIDCKEGKNVYTYCLNGHEMAGQKISNVGLVNALFFNDRVGVFEKGRYNRAVTVSYVH